MLTGLLAGALLDSAVFYFVYRHFSYHHGRSILVSQAIARATATLFDCLFMRRAVFRSKAVLLRYLGLVLGGGTVSYACIRLVTEGAQIPVFRTKIAVETLLFLASFAVQRDWVFQAEREKAATPANAWTFRSLDPLWLLLLIPLGLEIYGFRSVRLLNTSIWTAAGQRRFLQYAGVFGVGTEFFALYGRRYFYPVVVAAVVLCSVYAVGVVPVATVLLFVFSATVLGRLCFGDSTEGLLAFLAGTAFWIFAMYATLHLRVHYAATHLAALALPIAAGYRSSRRLAAEWLGLFRPAATSPGLAEFAASAGLAFVLLANWLIVLKPEVSTDGLSMHLAVPANIALHHVFTIDFHRFVWALMPIGADFIYSIVYTIGGEYAARLLNFAMLAGIACLLVKTARSFVSKPVALLMAMLFVSTPLAYLVTGSLFVENFVAFMLLGAVSALWCYHDTHATRYLMLTSVLLGASMALKLGAVTAGLLGLATLLFMMPRSPRRGSPFLAAGAAGIVLVLGSVPYASAWWQSGNPFFPFQTGPFQSPLVENDIRDLSFNHPISWQTPWDLTFHTSRYFEGQPGSFGFQYLLFLPLVLCTFIAVRSFKGRSAILLWGRRRPGGCSHAAQCALFLLHLSVTHAGRGIGTGMAARTAQTPVRSSGGGRRDCLLLEYLVPARGRLVSPRLLFVAALLGSGPPEISARNRPGARSYLVHQPESRQPGDGNHRRLGNRRCGCARRLPELARLQVPEDGESADEPGRCIPVVPPAGHHPVSRERQRQEEVGAGSDRSDLRLRPTGVSGRRLRGDEPPSGLRAGTSGAIIFGPAQGGVFDHS